MSARRLGLRGEALLLPLVALLLLLAVSAFTLFSYRSGIARLAEEERGRAARLAADAAAELAAEGRGTGAPGGAGVAGAERLRRLAPRAVRVLLLDAAGRPLAAAGEPMLSEEPAWPASVPAAGDLAGPVGAGPGEGLPPGVIAGFAPLGPRDERRVLRIDLAAGPLAAQLAGLRVLTPLVLGLDAAVLILLLLFLRHLWTPFDRLLERARRLDPAIGGGDGEGDEVALLVRTFERAVEALAARREEGGAAGAGGAPEEAGEADIAAISRTLAGSLESGVLLLDDAGAVLALNAIGAGLLGLEPPAPGTPAGEALGRHPTLMRCLEEALAEGRGVNRREIEIDAPTSTGAPDPAPFTLGLTVHPLRRDDGAVRGYLVLFADLTESRRRAEEARLAESLAGLGELAAGVAHELRNGLATLRGYLTLIARAPSREAAAAEYIGEIRREADHLERVLEDFLSFARPGSARLEAVDLLRVAHRVAADPALAGTAVAVEERRPYRPAARVQGDSQLLERAFRNLLLNAVQAHEAAAAAEPVVIAVTGDAERSVVTVEDRGRGIAPEIRRQLFKPFVTGRPGGVGLGLVLTLRILTLHRGTLTLEERTGGGTRARVVLPVDKSGSLGNSRFGSPKPKGDPDAAPMPLFSGLGGREP